MFATNGKIRILPIIIIVVALYVVTSYVVLPIIMISTISTNLWEYGMGVTQMKKLSRLKTIPASEVLDFKIYLNNLHFIIIIKK